MMNSMVATRLYDLFMNSLHLSYFERRNLFLLTICLPKLFTGAIASRGAARGNQLVSVTRDTGRIVEFT